MAFDLARYFGRIGFDGPATATRAALDRLIAAHIRSIPFENIDVFLGRPVSVDPRSLVRKLVDHRRGGYCFEHSGLFLEALRAIGFDARPVAAAIRLGVSDRQTRIGHAHVALIVSLKGEEWLVDVGFCAPPTGCALRLSDDAVQDTPYGPRRIGRAGDRRFLQVRRAERGWADVCEVSGTPMPLPDRVIANWFTSTHPDSRFRRELIVARPAMGGRWATLNGRVLTMWDAPGVFGKRTVADRADFTRVLDAHFGLRLPEDDASALWIATEPARPAPQ